MEFKLKAKLQKYKTDKGDWFYVSFDENLTEELRATFSKKHGWPRIKVSATVGETTWPSYIFKYEEAYCLVIKKEVREAEDLKEGDAVNLALSI